MKNLQRGFVLPLLLALVAILLVGSGAYVYTQNKETHQSITASPTVRTASTTQVSNQPIPGVPTPQTANWKTYRNDKGFEINYPANGWRVEMKNGGGLTDATNQAEIFTIINSDGTDSVFFNIVTLGSDRLGSSRVAAKNISQYLDLLPKTDQTGKVIRKFVQMVTVAGRQAYWYQTYNWSVPKQAYAWSSQVYFQHGNDIYEIEIDPSATNISNQILSTINFNSTPAPTVTANITVTYPNGGENLNVNDQDDLPKGINFVTRWTSNNLTGTINVYLISATDGSICRLGSAPVSEGSFGIVLGASFKCENTSKLLTSGQYKVRLIADTQSPSSNLGVNDMSDNYFTLNVLSSNTFILGTPITLNTTDT